MDGQPAARSQDGIYRLQRDCSDRTANLERDDELSGASSRSILLSAFQDSRKRVWTVTSDSVHVVETASGVNEYVNDLSFEKEHLSIVEVEEDGIVWMSVGDRLLRYDHRIVTNEKASFAPIVKSVSNVGSGQRIADVRGQPSLRYDDNDLLLEYSAPIYSNSRNLTYSHFLEGRENRWSDWSSENAVTFTNLREGAYTFRVKARNDFGTETPEARFSFVILPPWYRTAWAYIAYVLAIGIFGFLSTKYYQLAVANRKAKEQALELAREKVVNEKLQEANEQLQVVNERLTEVNTLKDEFLATTSHELRTPITAIQGYAAILKDELSGPHAEFADIIDSSSERLMRTLNAVLDLAKLRSGAVDLFPVVTHLQDFCLNVMSAYGDQAVQKEIAIVQDFTDEDLYTYIDQYSLRNIISNILDNAIKFSDGGSVTVSIARENKSAVITIADEGVGIADEFLPFVFEEFRQESETLSREQEGSGLGLAIASRMVDLVDGSIEVNSTLGVGTTIRLTFDLTLDHSLPVEQVDAAKQDREPMSRAHTHESKRTGKTA
ncbi:MAG: hypothetical protein HKN13_14315 [Rhodothermales bacterium]|nr:hypothetical protein [Rhodothermales bacterium]